MNNRITVTLDWGTASSKRKEGWCEHVELDPQFIKDNWKKLLKRQKVKCVIFQKLEEDFVLEKWEELTYSMQYDCLRKRKFSAEFCEKIFPGVEEEIQELILKAQPLSSSFVQHCWDLIPDEWKGSMLQEHILDLDFLTDILRSNKNKEVVAVALARQPLNEELLIEFWKEPYISNIVCNPNVPVSFLLPRLSDMTPKQTADLLSTHVLPEDTVVYLWEKYATDGEDSIRQACLDNQKVPTEIVQRDWETLPRTAISLALRKQVLGEEHIEKIWSTLSILGLGARNITLKHQKLSLEFLLKRWGEFTEREKALVVESQESMQQANLSQLPVFLTDSSAKVRFWAKKQYKHLTKGGRP